ncbi:SDR family oxidoreductase [Allorhizobium sp. BGMRC 0089]|uniref:SDR family oxidoreductase n=1 Tax=Allorhizobium sonneratiae TaxID=2934936 RepID=UPI0020342CF0|nr:SDR family oxidoreductase [Allorhizobium sonneratiae]MCM2292471.1 SDR family oxidoreductase [Allorhizobium sonneratiae]
MKVFVTGATGFIGSAVVRELLAHGHQVLGLARSDDGARAVAAAGAEVLQGVLEDLDMLKQAVRRVDGVIHTGFNHDFSQFARNCAVDRDAILAMGEALNETQGPMLVTSGLALLAPGRLAVESDAAHPVSDHYPRASEASALALADRGLKVSTVRLPPSVHGEGEKGFVPILIANARQKGFAAYPEQDNCWSGVHRLDAARAYRLALEKGASDGPYHVVADESVPMRSLAEAIGKGLNLPVRAINAEEAEAYYGWFHHFATMDMKASSALTRQKLGWEPKEISLLDDLATGHYFA